MGSDPESARRPRGFAAIDKARVSEIARKGGKAAHEQGTAHEFTSDEATKAGHLGGRVRTMRKRGYCAKLVMREDDPRVRTPCVLLSQHEGDCLPGPAT